MTDDLYPTKRRIRRPTLTTVLKQAKAAGINPASATIRPDGSISLQFSETEQHADNSWNSAIRDLEVKILPKRG
jgi:hypothetical protein